MKFTAYVKIRQEKFGAVIFETLTEKVFVTNETGKDILQLLQEGKTIDDIITTLEKEYGENSHVKTDVIDFIDELKKNNILEESVL